jgi:mannose-1-phosphate guanylyltransferase
MSSRPLGRVKALILAGGLGTRLRPLTERVPKCLVEIGGRPLLEYWFDALAAAGIRDVLINTHHLAEAVRCFLDQKRRAGFRPVEAFEATLLGSAGTIAAHPDWAGDAEHVVIIYADNFSDVDLSELLAVHRRHARPLTMLLFRAPDPTKCGVAEVDATGTVTAFQEKPATPRSDLANAGVYAVTAAAWREIAAMHAFDLGFDVLPVFAGRIRAHVHGGYHRDIGDAAALEAARRAAPSVFRPKPRPKSKEDTQR